MAREPIDLITENGTYEGDDAIGPIKQDLVSLRDELAEVGDTPGRPGRRGKQGPTGPPGKDGTAGADGRDGVDGRDGAPGADGPPGEPGEPGKDGLDGKDGRDGVDGADGRDGIDGSRGERGPPGADGTDGKDGLPGADGKDGAPGRDGLDGKDGPPGKDGAPGRDGRDGVDGRDGERGPPGRDGGEGPPGRDGTDGRDGVDGADGLPGLRGPKGEPGLDGRNGDRGPDGLPGLPGVGFNWRGAWQPNETYSRNDVVRDKGSAWVALIENSVKPHLESTAWDLMVPRGRTGPAGPPGGGSIDLPIPASDISVTNDGYDTAQDIFDALLYVALQITAFTGGGNFEIGSTVNSVNLAWSYNKDVTSQSINQGIGSLDPADRAENLTGLGLTTNRTWTLSATDGTTPRTANTTVSFLPKRYWGPFADNAPDNSEILTLSNELTSGRAKAVTYDCTGGRYPIYAWPKSFGALSGVTVGGLAFSDYSVSEMSFTNAQGYTQDYYVFVFNTIQTGSAINVVFS